jgi:hypothetical protein
MRHPARTGLALKRIQHRILAENAGEKMPGNIKVALAGFLLCLSACGKQEDSVQVPPVKTAPEAGPKFASWNSDPKVPNQAASPEVDMVAQWFLGELSGDFRGKTNGNYIRGTGLTRYSFSFCKAVEGRGDIELVTLFSEDDDRHEAILICDRILDLGPLPKPPRQVRMPTDFSENDDYADFESTPMAIGRYYFVVSGGLSILLQVLDIEFKDIKLTNKGWLNNTLTTNCTLRFRYISSPDGTMGLNRVIAIAPEPLENAAMLLASAAEATTVAPLSGPDSIRADGSTAAAPLLTEYEGFQDEAKNFLDASADGVSLEACDEMLRKGTELGAGIEARQLELASGLTSEKTLVQDLKNQAQVTTNLQVRDRINTITNSHEKKHASMEAEIDEWRARKAELDTTLSGLREYRKALERLKY